MGTLYTDPPIWLPANTNNIVNINPPGNRWSVSLNVVGPQIYGNGNQYDGTHVTTGMWIANNFQGFAWKIVSISYQDSSTINCIIEDVNNWNANSDPQGFGNGEPLASSLTYIFQLQANGLPGITSITDAQLRDGTDTWPDNLLGRFIANQPGNFTGPTGPTGTAAPKYYSEFPISFSQIPNENDSINYLNVGTGLAYTPNESVILTNLIDSSTRFEAIVNSYNIATGLISLMYITNVLGTSYTVSSNFSINLAGQRGSKWYAYPSGPTGTYASTGRIGDYYIDENTGYVYVRR